MKQPTFSVLIPSYKSAGIIGETIKSVLAQTFGDFELIISDDNSPDKTEQAIKKFTDPRIKFYKNEKNLGYSGNLEACRQKATGKYIYLLGNDDILSPQALEKTLSAFNLDEDIGVVTRPYYWFENNNINTAVRVVKPLDEKEDRVISIFESKEAFRKVMESVGQLSGLALRREWIDRPVHKDIFPAHIYPFLSIFKKHKAVFLKDYILAVRIFSSQTRVLSSIYDPSPTFTWVRMFDTVLEGKKYTEQRKWGVEHICLNHEGLAQIKNYASYRLFLREAWLLVRYYPQNLLNLRFWLIFLGLAILPRSASISLVDWYKRSVNAKTLSVIKLFKQ